MVILVINGVNLNMLGSRNKEIYGTQTLSQLNKSVAEYAKDKGAKTVFRFSNCEGKLVEFINNNKADAIVLNAGAYSHYSYALRDAIECCKKPVVEVHLSDITKREDFRKIRVFDGVATACFFGEGQKSYFKAIDFLVGEKNEN